MLPTPNNIAQQVNTCEGNPVPPTTTIPMEESRSPQINNNCCDNNNDDERKETRGAVDEVKLSSSSQEPAAAATQTAANETTLSSIGSSGCACGETDGDRDTKSCCVEENNRPDSHTTTATTAPFDNIHSSEKSCCVVSSSEILSSHTIIPGIEHVFFEEELQKMEQAQASKEHSNIVVLAADGSAHSELAFKFYKDNVDRPGYYLHVVHHSDVWSHYTPNEEGNGPSVDHCKELVEKAKGAVDGVAEKYKKLMDEHKIKGETVVLHGKDAWHDIIQHQEKTNAMMIVMGTRGHGALSRTFRGSVSDSVVHHANVPVLVCCHPKDHSKDHH